MWNRIKQWARRAYIRGKSWLLAVLVAVGILVSPQIFATDVTLTWTNATLWDDGAPLQPGDLTATVLQHQLFVLGTDVSTAPRDYAILATVQTSETSYIHTDVANGIHCYIAYHVAKNGTRSAASNEFCKTIDTRNPGPPAGLGGS